MLSSKIFDCAPATHLLKWITICLFLSSCSASINDVFTVKKGIDKGGCDNYSGVLTNWFSEVQVLLEAGLQAFIDAENNDPLCFLIRSQDLREYTFGPVYGDDPSTSSYCGTDTSDAVDKNLAGTDDETIPATVTLCPLSFNTPNFRSTLNFITPNTDGDAPDSVEDFLPRSATLLHESIHLVLSKGQTLDASYDLDEVKAAIMRPNKIPKTVYFSDPDNILGTTPLNEALPGERKLTNIQLVRRNPETFVWFCVSYWYYLQDPIPNNVVATNFRYTFPAGNAVRVDVVV